MEIVFLDSAIINPGIFPGKVCKGSGILMLGREHQGKRLFLL